MSACGFFEDCTYRANGESAKSNGSERERHEGLWPGCSCGRSLGDWELAACGAAKPDALVKQQGLVFVQRSESTQKWERIVGRYHGIDEELVS